MKSSHRTARFVREAKSAPEYRIYPIGDVHPAMLRVPTGATAVALSDGVTVLGVLGEPWLCEQGNDITRHGGWRSYLAAREAAS